MKLNLYNLIFLCLILNSYVTQSMNIEETPSTSPTYDENEDIGTIPPHNSLNNSSNTSPMIPGTPIGTQILEIHELVQDIQSKIDTEQENTKKMLVKISTSEKTIENLNLQIQKLQQQTAATESFQQTLTNKITNIKDRYLYYLSAKDKTGLTRYTQQAAVITLSAAVVFMIYKALCQINKTRIIQAKKREKIEKIINKLIQNEEKLNRLIVD